MPMMMPQGMPMGGPPMGGPPPQGMPMGGPPMEGMPMGGPPPMEGMPMGGPPPMEGMPMGEAPMEDMGEELAEEGRGGDEIMGHLTPGEIVIPVDMQDDELIELLDEFFAESGKSMAQYTVGNEENSINPETGMPEFYYGASSRKRKHTPRKYKKTRGATEEDYARFDKYMTDYTATRKTEDKEMARYAEYTTGSPMTNTPLGFGGDTRGSFVNDWMDRWVGGDSRGEKALRGFFRKGKKGAAQMADYKELHEKYRGHQQAQYQYQQGPQATQGWRAAEAMGGLGKPRVRHVSELTPHQQKGAWQHGEDLGEGWSEMSLIKKKEAFEDYFGKLEASRKWGLGAASGAGGAYGQGKGKAYKTSRQEKSDKNFKSWESEMDKAFQDQQALFALQLEGERARAEEDRKRAVARQARLNKAGQMTTTGASETVGSIVDARSMVSRSYARRSSSQNVGSITGFRSTGLGTDNRPS